MTSLHVTTYNIHKGFSQFNQRMVVHELRERLRELTPDIVFLQEVQGLHLIHAERHDDWPDSPQHEFLAEDVWHATAYGRNVIYDHGHHGNAILSRFPILASHNQDVTHLRFEKRGILHCAIDVPGLSRPLHCVCVHLSLFGRSRRRQMDALATRLEAIVPADAPLIIAGDFNDWRNRAHDDLAERLGMDQVQALNFLQEDDVWREFAQPLAQLMQYHTAVELGEPLVDVIGGDLEVGHGMSE